MTFPDLGVEPILVLIDSATTQLNEQQNVDRVSPRSFSYAFLNRIHRLASVKLILSFVTRIQTNVFRQFAARRHRDLKERKIVSFLSFVSRYSIVEGDDEDDAEQQRDEDDDHRDDVLKNTPLSRKTPRWKVLR